MRGNGRANMMHLEGPRAALWDASGSRGLGSSPDLLRIDDRSAPLDRVVGPHISMVCGSSTNPAANCAEIEKTPLKQGLKGLIEAGRAPPTPLAVAYTTPTQFWENGNCKWPRGSCRSINRQRSTLNKWIKLALNVKLSGIIST